MTELETTKFESIKIGDKVVIGSWHHDDYIKEVTKVGKTFIEVDNTKFSNKNGSIKPFGSMSAYIKKLATDEDAERINKKKKRKKVSNYFNNFHLYTRVSDEIINKLEDILNEIESYKENGK